MLVYGLFWMVLINLEELKFFILIRFYVIFYFFEVVMLYIVEKKK